MWKWFKRKNAQAEVDKEKGTTKINAGDVAVEVDGKKITVAELQEAMITQEAEEAEIAKKAELEKELEPVSMDDTFVASNGKEYKIGDLVANWKKRNVAGPKKEDKVIGDIEKEEGDKEEKEAKENAEKDLKEKEEKLNALKVRANACGLAENATEEEIVKAEEDKKNAADAEAKAKADAEAKEKEEAEKRENAKRDGKAFFKELHNASHASEGPVASVGRSRAERAAGWASRNKKR